MKEVVIDSIRVSLQNYQRVIILQVKEEETYLPIWIGPAEADAIAVKTEDVQLPRPLTHDLFQAFLSISGTTLSRVVICEELKAIFYAKLILEQKHRTLEMDSRPSDAIAIAIRIGVPMFIEDSIVERVGIKLEDIPPTKGEPNTKAGDVAIDQGTKESKGGKGNRQK